MCSSIPATKKGPIIELVIYGQKNYLFGCSLEFMHTIYLCILGKNCITVKTYKHNYK